MCVKGLFKGDALMTKYFLLCLAVFSLVMSPVCFAESSVVETEVPAEDAESRNTLAEAAKAASPGPDKQADEKTTKDLDKPVSRAARTEKEKSKTEPKIARAPRENRWDYVLGAGIVISPDYKDMMEEAYGSVDASTIGWVDLQLGLRYKLSEYFTLTPGLDILFNYFVPEEEDRFISHILLPSLGIQYAFENNPAYYLGAEISYPVADSGSEELDLSASGPGFSAFLGYMMENEWNLEFGYSFLPVENGPDDEAEEYNLGGFVLKINRRF